MAEVVVVGSYVQDHAWLVDRFPRPGETRRAHGFNTGPGGKGFNQAVACARQGVSSAFIGAIGEDHLGLIARDFALAEKLPCRWLVRRDQPTAASSILVEAGGQNQIAVSLGANEWLDVDFVRAQADLFAGARVLLCQLENNLDAIAAALALGKQQALACILNPAPVHADLDRPLFAAADILTPNETEFALLLARFANVEVDPATLAARADADLHALARRLGDATLVVTLGGAGCFVSHALGAQRGDAEPYYRVPAERVAAIDATGAGDAFSGGLAAALVRFAERPFRHAVRHAGRVAALSTEKVGTAPAMPTGADVEARFGA